MSMKTKLVIIPTIDVEGTHGNRPFEQLILGQVGTNEEWGVRKIAKILHKYDADGTFFVDVYEHTLWGMEPWEQVCVALAKQGQDVQLHTHPGWRDDPRDFDWIRELKRTKSFLGPEKDFMAKLSLKEQIDVLQYGSDLLYKWLGVRPIAHRSGGYSIDENTILALCQTGFKVDSSQNRAHPNSKLYWTFNAVTVKNGILQIPLTIYDRCFLSVGPRLRGTFRRLKTSVRFSKDSELVGFCKIALEVGLPVMNLFMHSYSLLKMDKYFKKNEPSIKSVRRLEAILRWGKEHPDVEIMSLSKYYESGLWRNYVSSSPDIVPRFAQGRQLIIDLFNKIRYTMA
jgi:hypothetical protein